MANEFSNSFTGKNIIAPLPSSEGLQKSQENMDNLILGAEKLKADIFQKNQEAFLKTANIPPEFVLSDSARQTQAQLLDQFNAKWGGVMRQRGGDLTMDDKIQMAKDKDYILMQQQQMQASMVRAMKDREDVQKDVQGNLDHDDFNNRWNNFIKTGNYDTSPLMPSAISPNEYFNQEKNKFNGTPTNIPYTETIGGVPQKFTKTASGTEEQARGWVQDRLHGDDRFARGVIQEFQNLKTTNPTLYKQYLDTDKNGVVSPDEEKASQSAKSNPILKYAQDTYWQNALKLGESKPVSLGGNKSKTAVTPVDVGGQKVPIPPARQQTEVRYGNRQYVQPYTFGGNKAFTVSTDGGVAVSSDGEETPLTHGVMTANLLHYVRQGNKLIFTNASNAKENPELENSIAIEIPATNLANYMNLPIIDDGKAKTVGDIIGAQPTATSQTSVTDLSSIFTKKK